MPSIIVLNSFDDPAPPPFNGDKFNLLNLADKSVFLDFNSNKCSLIIFSNSLFISSAFKMYLSTSSSGKLFFPDRIFFCSFNNLANFSKDLTNSSPEFLNS